MTLNNFQLPDKRGQPKWVGGKPKVNTLTSLSTKVDVRTQRLNHLNTNVANSNGPPPYEICGSIDHLAINYQVGSPFAKDTRHRSMTLIPVPTIRVGGIIKISYIGLTLLTCPRQMLDHPGVSKASVFPTSSPKV